MVQQCDRNQLRVVSLVLKVRFAVTALLYLRIFASENFICADTETHRQTVTKKVRLCGENKPLGNNLTIAALRQLVLSDV